MATMLKIKCLPFRLLEKKRISAATFTINRKRNRDDKCYDANGLQSSIN